MPRSGIGKSVRTRLRAGWTRRSGAEGFFGGPVYGPLTHRAAHLFWQEYKARDAHIRELADKAFDWETTCGLPKTQKEETSMTENNFPKGWDQDRVRKVLAHYDEQPDDEALAEDEAGVASSETVMSVPHDLVSQARELIAQHHD
jgi:hypothetical protein